MFIFGLQKARKSAMYFVFCYQFVTRLLNKRAFLFENQIINLITSHFASESNC